MPMKKNIKILILGGTGYLGQKLVNDLQKSKYTIYNPNRSTLNLESNTIDSAYLESVLNNIDIIINCAVYQLTGDNLIRNKSQIEDRNYKINESIIEIFKLSESNTKLITIGASCAYSCVHGKTSYDEGPLHPSVQAFAAPKRRLSQDLRNLNSKTGQHYSILVPGTLVGPGEQLDESKKHFFNGTIFRYVKYIKRTENDFKKFGNMDAVRELTNIKTFSDYIVENCQHLPLGINNIIPDYRIKVEQLYDYLISLSGPSKVVDSKTKFLAVEQKSHKVDVVEDLSNNHDFKDSSIRDLINQTVNYYENRMFN